MKRYKGKIRMKCHFDDKREPKVIDRPYDALCLRMPNGVVVFAKTFLTRTERAHLTQVQYAVQEPYDPFPCEKCGELHDCRLDAWQCCGRLPGETDDQFFDRVVAPALEANKNMLTAAVEFIPDGEVIPYDVATQGIILEENEL